MFFCFLSTMGAIIETKLLIYTQCVVANDDHGGTGVCKVCSHHPAPSLVRFPDPHYVVGRENEPLWDGAVFFRGP